MDLFTSGTLLDPVAERLPLGDVGGAQRKMQARQSNGKFVLKPWLTA